VRRRAIDRDVDVDTLLVARAVRLAAAGAPWKGTVRDGASDSCDSESGAAWHGHVALVHLARRAFGYASAMDVMIATIAGLLHDVRSRPLGSPEGGAE
jgi:hypothetical protein